MTHEEYYAECISIAADECGLIITTEQALYIGDAVLGSVENFSMSYGYDVASSNLRAAGERADDDIKQRLHYEQTVSRTRCRTCQGHGFTRDVWGRDSGCNDCGGKGNTPDWPFALKARGQA